MATRCGLFPSAAAPPGAINPNARTIARAPAIWRSVGRVLAIMVFLMALPFPDLAQDLRRVLAQLRRRTRRCHRRAVDHDRRAHARNGAALGLLARERELHAAVLHMRVGEYLVERVD